jgi:hypothetical protein
MSEVADWSKLDQPQILMFVFHPREDWTPTPPGTSDHLIPVADDVSISGRFYATSLDAPSILYFHGNGEVVYDYDDIAPLYNSIGANLFVVDYRGYGQSGGSPTFSNTVSDARAAFEYFRDMLKADGYTGPSFIMGRSLGSLSAVEIASKYADGLQGLIIESGFASVSKLLLYLIPIMTSAGLEEFERANLARLNTINLPVLLIHGEHDEIIPAEQAQVFYDNVGSSDKTLLTIPQAGHNDILLRGMDKYFSTIREFLIKHSP